jgi:flagellin-like protein
MDKKGISPLIATVLIIGFTIVAAILVITWINSLVGDTTDEQACRTEALDICIASESALSYDVTSGGVATVTNSGSEAVDIKVLFLLGGAADPACSMQELDDIPAYDTMSTTACGTADQVKFIQEVSSTVNGVSCTETCGAGKVVDVV